MAKNHFPLDEKTPLIAECVRRVESSEEDHLNAPWQTLYIKYFEQGRIEWERKFEFSPYNMIQNGFTMPIVRFWSKFYHPLQYGELVRIKTACYWTEAAKMNMSYEIFRENGALSAKGYTVQLYTDLSGQLLVLRPEPAESFFQRWDDWINQQTDCLLVNH